MRILNSAKHEVQKEESLYPSPPKPPSLYIEGEGKGKEREASL